ncbi:MAG: hypothetical protein ABSG68_26860 [Thermoguttaceae bacterium]|jgi:hypothetical protein
MSVQNDAVDRISAAVRGYETRLQDQQPIQNGYVESQPLRWMVLTADLPAATTTTIAGTSITITVPAGPTVDAPANANPADWQAYGNSGAGGYVVDTATDYFVAETTGKRSYSQGEWVLCRPMGSGNGFIWEPLSAAGMAAFWNDESSAAAPPYAVMAVTGMHDLSGSGAGPFLPACKRVTTALIATQRQYLVNGATQVAAQSSGAYQDAWEVKCLYGGTGTPAVEDVWAPTAGQWYLTKKDKLAPACVWGVVDAGVYNSANSVLLGKQWIFGSVHPLFWNDESSADAPPCALMMVTGLHTLPDGTVVLAAKQPAAITSQPYRRHYIVNGSDTVAHQSSGRFQDDWEVEFAYSSGTPALEDVWGPAAAGGWYAEKKSSSAPDCQWGIVVAGTVASGIAGGKQWIFEQGAWCWARVQDAATAASASLAAWTANHDGGQNWPAPVKPCNPDGSLISGAVPFAALTPIDPERDTDLYPNATADDGTGSIVFCQRDGLTGQWMIVGEKAMGDKAHTVKLWNSTSGPPRGWALFTAMADRHPVYPGVVTGQTALGNQGGYTWHGKACPGDASTGGTPGTNDHPDHNDLAACYLTNLLQGTPGSGQSNVPGWLLTADPTGIDYEHLGPFNNNKDTDNRSLYYCVYFIQRVLTI